jgi:hypothetical protein
MRGAFGLLALFGVLALAGPGSATGEPPGTATAEAPEQVADGTATATAEESTGGPPGGVLTDYTSSTSATAGYRFVNTTGSEDKYREDYNLQEGPRLFDFALDSASSAPDRTFVDRLSVLAETPGNEPVSRFRLTASGRERFKLGVNFIRSKYRYAVPELWDGPVDGNVRTSDLHDFNIVRTNGSVDLTIHSRNLPKLHFGYRLYDRDTGTSTTSTVRIPDGDTFVVRAPSATTTNVGLADVTFDVFDTNIFLQQEYRSTVRDLTLQDPRNPAGVDPTDASTLSFYRSRQTEDIHIPVTRVRLNRSIGRVVDLSSGYFFSQADLGSDRNRVREGTNNDGFEDTSTVSDNGDALLTTHIVDAAASVHFNDRVRAHAAYRFNYRDQDGSLDEVSEFGRLRANTDDDLRINRVTLELEFQPRANLLMRGGLHYTHRDANLSINPGSQTTDTVGAIGSVRFVPWSFLNLSARYENVQADDPYTVAGSDTNVPPLPSRESGPDTINRGSAGIGIKPFDWMEFRYRLRADSRENNSFRGSSWALANSVSFTVTPIEGLTFLGSYSLREIDQRYDILVAPLYEPASDSVQSGTEQVFTSMLRYDFSAFEQRWATGWNVAFVDSTSTLGPRLETGGGTRTTFDLDRVDGGIFLTLFHRFIEPTVEFRMINYSQSPLGDNDYQTTIVALKLTKRLDF